MSVLDASLLTDALVAAGPPGDVAIARIQADRQWQAPHLLPAEVMSAIRRLQLAGHVAEHVASAAQDRLRRMRLILHAFEPYHERVWALRRNATAYDAWYLAVAERIGAPLVTSDAKLAAVPGARCTVEVVSAARG